MKNLAQEARSAISTFLLRDFSQARFAELIETPIRTIQGWEQGRRIPRGSAASNLLRLIVQDPSFMVAALVQMKLTQQFHIQISPEIASEIVHTILRSDKPEEMRKKAAFAMLRKILRAKRTAEQATYEVIDGMRCRVTTITPHFIKVE